MMNNKSDAAENDTGTNAHIEQEEKESGADLGTLLGLEQPPGTQLDDVNEKSLKDPREVNNISDKKARYPSYKESGTSGSGTKAKRKRPGLKKNSPALWMREPERHAEIMESFRTLGGKIATMNEKNSLRVFLLTGSEDNVGTSTVALNLSLMMGWDMPDRRILIADANMDRPVLHRVWDRSSEHGLMDYLLDRLPLAEIIQPTFLPNLDIVTLARTDDEVLSPFSLQSFGLFLKEVRELYDFVLLDSAPVLSSSHTKIVSAKTDAVIIVAEANRTHFEALEEIIRQLKGEGAYLAGSFLNKRRYVIPKLLYRYI